MILFHVALYYSGLDSYVWHLVWVAALSVLFYSYLPFVEKIHVALFGLFGFLSYRVFRLHSAVFVCVAVAGLDELLQHFLVSRVGDWRDVWLNIFSVSLGLFLAFLFFADGYEQATDEDAR